MRFGLYPKFMLLMVSLAVIPVGFVGFQLITINERGIQAAVLELHTTLAQTLAEEVDSSLKSTDDKIKFTLAALGQRLDWSAKQGMLRAYIETNPNTEELAIVDLGGRELLAVYNPALEKHGGLESHGSDPGFRQFSRTRTRAARMEPGSPVPRMVLYYPFPNGYSLFASVRMTRMWDRVQKARPGGTGFAVVVDRAGRPVLYPEGLLDAPARAAFAALPIVVQGLRALSVGASDFTDPAGKEEVGAYAPVPELGGAVVALQPRREAFAAAYQMRLQAVVVVAVFGVLALLLSWWTSRQLSQPILALTRGAEQVAQGDFGATVSIDTGDELHDLAETFNFMTAQLKRYAELQVDRMFAEQKKLEAILFSIADGILMTDYEGRIQVANRRARSILGLPADEPLENRFITELIPDPEIGRALAEIIRSPGEDQYRELDLSSDLYRRIYRVSAQPVLAPGHEESKGVVAALHDVTLEKELEKIKEDFIHSMTHDLRSPMASIRGFLEILLKGETGPLTPAQRRMMESMDKASFRLLGMINNILDTAKMRAGRMDVQLVRCSLREVTERVLEVVEPLAGRKHLKVSIKGDAPAVLNADPDLMERVFTNLLSNAIKFTPESGRIEVEFKDFGDEVEVSVRDTGPGIPAEMKDRLFERFQQGKNHGLGGSGLGLAICRFIVEAHRGMIRAEAAPGGGTKVAFRVPKNLAQNLDGSVIALQAQPLERKGAAS